MKLPHLIYGTFPDLPGSQQVVYKSPAITEEIQISLIKFYDEFGDCKNEDFKSSLSVVWFTIGSGERIATVTKVTHSGKDFSGRWGALLRHSIVLKPEEFRALYFDPSYLTPFLIETGTSDELSASLEIEVEPPRSLDQYLETQALVDVEKYRDNLTRLLAGERLALYSETNNEYSNGYLLGLVRLMPIDLREQLNWSEFVFRSSESLDLSLVYSSRHEAPDGDSLKLTPVGESSLKKLNLEAGAIAEYVDEISKAWSDHDPTSLARKLSQTLVNRAVGSSNAGT